MVDYTSTLQKLRDIDWKINNINNLDELNNVISRRVSDLYSVLSSNNFFINQDVSREIDNIESRLNIWWTLITEAQWEIARLVAERAALPAWATSNTRRSEIWREIWKLLRVTWWTEAAPWNWSTTRIQDRHNDYNNIKVAKDSFNINNTLADHSHTLWVASTYANLNWVGKFACTPVKPVNWFHFFDENWNRINASSWKYKFKMKLDDGSETDVKVEGLTITDWTWIPPYSIVFSSNVKFDPSNIDFSKPLELNIWWVYENVWGTGINVIHTKKLKTKFLDANFLPDQPALAWEFDNYNNSGPWNRISGHLTSRYDSDIHKLEREAIERALKDWDGPKYEQLTPEQKEQFYQHIRSLNHPTLAGADFFSALNPGLNLNSYNHFRDWFTHDDRDWNKDIKIKTRRKYNDFIHNNLETKSTEYINSQLDSDLIDNMNTNRFLKSELTTFFDRIRNNREDDNVHSVIDNDLDDKNHKMKKWPRSLLYPRDKNYMRFFSWSSKRLDNQEVDISTNSEPEDLNNKEPVKYNITTSVSWRNKIQAEIEIEWEKKKLQFKAWEPSALVHKIMRDHRIKYGKVRAHIAYNIYKSIIQIAKDKDLSLRYRQDNEHMRLLDIDENENIVLKNEDAWTNRGGSNKADTQILFDQQLFKNTNDFNTPGYNWSLRHGIENISYHFNLAMNQVHRQYRRAVKRRLLWLVHSPSRPKLPSSIRLSPIKKILNYRTNTNFDFSTTIDSNWKQISVNFRKNKYTINMEWLKKSISWRDLWKLLCKRQWRKRVFDGMDRDIAEWIYSALMEKLRTNSKIARSNFGAIDDITWNLYILDSDGQFGMITKEQLDTEKNPVHWWLFSRKQYWVINKNKLDKSGYQILDEKQKAEMMKNPFLMQRIMKAANTRMWFFESTRAIFSG